MADRSTTWWTVVAPCLMLGTLRCFSAYNGCKEWLLKLLLSTCHLKPACPFLSHPQGISTHRTAIFLYIALFPSLPKTLWWHLPPFWCLMWPLTKALVYMQDIMYIIWWFRNKAKLSVVKMMQESKWSLFMSIKKKKNHNLTVILVMTWWCENPCRSH